MVTQKLTTAQYDIGTLFLKRLRQYEKKQYPFTNSVTTRVAISLPELVKLVESGWGSALVVQILQVAGHCALRAYLLVRVILSLKRLSLRYIRQFHCNTNIINCKRRQDGFLLF